MILKETGSTSEMKFVPDRKAHDRRYAIDASKIERELGWTPAHTFEEALPLTIKWYQENQAWVESCREKVQSNFSLEDYELEIWNCLKIEA